MLWFILISEIGAHLREWHLRILCPGWEAHLPHPSSPTLFGKIPLLKSSPKLWILKGLDPLCWCDNTSLPPFVGFAAKVLCLRPSAKGLPWIAGARSAWRFMSLRWPFANVWQRPRYKGPAHWLPDLPNSEAQFLSQSFLEYQLRLGAWPKLPAWLSTSPCSLPSFSRNPFCINRCRLSPPRRGCFWKKPHHSVKLKSPNLRASWNSFFPPQVLPMK